MHATNNIKNLRLQTGLSRKDFSEEVGIPYMTLTDWELGKHEAPAYVYRLLEYYVRMKNQKDAFIFHNSSECHIWEEQGNFRTSFPVVSPHPVVPVNHIYPLKQKDAIRIHDALKDDSRINNIILFGSSVTMKCGNKSDMDLSVRLHDDFINNDVKNEVSENIQSICDWKTDIIWFDHIKKPSQLFNNILKGVQIL